MVGGEEYYLSPQEALKFKLIDEIVPAIAAKRREAHCTAENTQEHPEDGAAGIASEPEHRRGAPASRR